MRIAVSYHDPVTKLQGLALPAAGPFDRAEWFALLAAHAAEPLLGLAESPAGRVALPLMRVETGLAALCNWFTFSFRPLTSAHAEPLPLLTALAADLRRRSHRVDLAPVPGEDGSAELLAAAFRAAGWRCTLEVCDENHVLPVGGRDFAAYWAARPGPLRTTVKRKAGKVETRILTQFEEDAWASYRQIYGASWKPAEERADILEAFARAEGTAGRLRLGLATHAGEPVAAQFWTVEQGTAYIHKLAHTEAAKPLSAGSVLTAALFRHVIDTDRVALVDFGTGSDPYKRDWMEACRPRYRLSALDPRAPRAWPALARRALARLARPNRGG